MISVRFNWARRNGDLFNKLHANIHNPARQVHWPTFSQQITLPIIQKHSSIPMPVDNNIPMTSVHTQMHVASWRRTMESGRSISRLNFLPAVVFVSKKTH